MSQSNRDAIYDNAIVRMERIFHATANNVEAAEDKTIQNKSTDCHGTNKTQKTQNIFECRIFLCKRRFLFHTDYFSISGGKPLERVKIDKDMADYVMLRKGRNALSSVTHVVLNIALAVISTALTVISGNWIFGVLLVILSKWRIVAVRPRYWWLNFKANLVDLTVGISLALLVYLAGTDGLNVWHIVLTIIYAVWLVIIKPMSQTFATEVQAMFAIFFGTFATALITSGLDPIVGVIFCFVIGYGASRHILMQGSDHDFNLTTFICGLLLGELSWIFYHWSIVYRIGVEKAFIIPQLPIVASLMFFVFARGYGSALRHDGKIRSDDIMLPALFSAIIMFVMVFFFSVANFDI